jgi:hypothetical protein
VHIAFQPVEDVEALNCAAGTCCSHRRESKRRLTWWLYADEELELLRRTILNRGRSCVTPLHIEFANRVNYVVRVGPR